MIQQKNAINVCPSRQSRYVDERDLSSSLPENDNHYLSHAPFQMLLLSRKSVISRCSSAVSPSGSGGGGERNLPRAREHVEARALTAGQELELAVGGLDDVLEAVEERKC